MEQISAAEAKFVPPADLEKFVKNRKKAKKKKDKLQKETGHRNHESHPSGKDAIYTCNFYMQ